VVRDEISGRRDQLHFLPFSLLSSFNIKTNYVNYDILTSLLMPDTRAGRRCDCSFKAADIRNDAAVHVVSATIYGKMAIILAHYILTSY